MQKQLIICSVIFGVTQHIQAQQDEMHIHQSHQIVKQKKVDSLKLYFKSRFTVGIHYGSFLISENAKGDKDNTTGIDIAAVTTRWGANIDYYISNKLAIGTEIGLHNTKRTQEVNLTANGISIKGNGGTNLTTYFYGKFFLNKQTKQVIAPTSYLQLNPYLVSVDDSLSTINSINNKKMMKPRIYLLGGIGNINSLLLRVKASETYASVKTYQQSHLSLLFGVGCTSRIAKTLLLECGVRYLLSNNYDPSIGGLKSYSGVNLQLNIQYIFKAGFNKLR